MNKKFLFYVVIALALVAAAVLYLLNVLEVITWFSLSWAVLLFSGVAGVMFILQGLIGKGNVVLKKWGIYFGAGLLVVALFALVSAIAAPTNIILPIIAIIVTVALLLGVLATGGKKWDTGDNQKVGYKNYHQRKAEEEKLEKENKDKED